MKTPVPPFLLFAALLGLAAGSAFAADPAAAQPTPRNLRVLELRGSAYERGLQHGRELRPEIARILALWKEDLRKESKSDPDALIRRFHAATNFIPAIKQWTPGLMEEVRGIADGSGQPFDLIYAFQLLDEIWVFMDIPVANHCSALGVAKSGGHPAYVAQTMDLEPFRDGFQVVLHIIGDATTPEQFVFSSVGLIGVNGVNRHSIAIACNCLMELTASPDGLPVAFFLRGVLAQISGDTALAFVRNVRHASGQNYVVGARDRVYDFEASAGKVVRFQPVADGSVVFHTNHALANDDLKPWHRQKPASESVNSRTRLTSLQTRLAQPAAKIDGNMIQAALRAKDSAEHPVCRTLKPGADGFTFGATIMTLSETPSFAVTMGPPDVNPFVHLAFAAAVRAPASPAKPAQQPQSP
jgi:isopenicillin-N N-acyltransferase-like protein